MARSSRAAMTVSLLFLVLFLVCPVRATDDKDFARYRDIGHMTGLIGNYLCKPRGPLSMASAGEYKITFYWITRANKHDRGKLVQILVRCPESGHEDIVDVHSSFKRRLDREGTAMLEDGRLINVLRRGETKRYLDISTKYPTGLGCANNRLTPFISVAVSDKNEDLSFGDTIYIPEIEGAPLPDGGKHDGMFKVEDTGRALTKNQIDIFLFVKNNWPQFARRLKPRSRTFFVYKVFSAPRATEQ